MSTDVRLWDHELFDDMPQGEILLPATRNFGLCDPDGGDRNNAVPLRYSTVLIPLVQNGAGDLVCAADTDVVAFDKGVGETGQGYTYKASLVETNSYEDGAMIPEMYAFIVRALGFHLFTFTMAGDPTAQHHPMWLEPYIERIQDVFLNQLAFSISFPQNACSWFGGPLSAFPQHANSLGAEDRARNGAGIGIANLFPLRRVVVSGWRDSINKMEVHIQSPHVAVAIDQDPNNHTASTVQLAVQVYSYGKKAGLCQPACPPMPPGSVTILSKG